MGLLTPRPAHEHARGTNLSRLSAQSGARAGAARGARTNAVTASELSSESGEDSIDFKAWCAAALLADFNCFYRRLRPFLPLGPQWGRCPVPCVPVLFRTDHRKSQCYRSPLLQEEKRVRADVEAHRTAQIPPLYFGGQAQLAGGPDGSGLGDGPHRRPRPPRIRGAQVFQVHSRHRCAVPTLCSGVHTSHHSCPQAYINCVKVPEPALSCEGHHGMHAGGAILD